jgi:serine/threonine protein kinase
VDFGFARYQPTDNQLMKTPCFTLNYAAPEVLKQALSTGIHKADAGYDASCDVRSIYFSFKSKVVLIQFFLSIDVESWGYFVHNALWKCSISVI